MPQQQSAGLGQQHHLRRHPMDAAEPAGAADISVRGSATAAQLARLWASPEFWCHCRERGLSDGDLRTLEHQLAAYRVGVLCRLSFMLLRAVKQQPPARLLMQC